MKYKEVYLLQTLKTYLFFSQQPSRSNSGSSYVGISDKYLHSRHSQSPGLSCDRAWLLVLLEAELFLIYSTGCLHSCANVIFERFKLKSLTTYS